MSRVGLLIANRGEIAIRIARAGGALDLRAVTVFSSDDAASLHVHAGDDAFPLGASGPQAYLDAAALVSAAVESDCALLHPGYGFLSESVAFARLCEERAVTFVGPRPETLELLGDKTMARALAERCGVPVLRATSAAVGIEDARSFVRELGGGAALLKAVAGGGGRGMRVLRTLDEFDEVFERSRSEAEHAFGDGSVFVEEFLDGARHVEVQIVGDGSGAVCDLGDRDCTLQQRFQKLVEIAPAPFLTAEVRSALRDAALRMASETAYLGVGTFEFLVAGDRFAFIEANPRLQVEHTVTEQVTGVDLVQVQLHIAQGRSLADVGLGVPVEPRGFAVQARVNFGENGGELTVFEPPTGPGVRVDSYGYAGYRANPRFDSLLAKVVGAAPAPYAAALARTQRALSEFRVEGAETNLSLLQALLAHPDVVAGRVHTMFLEERSAELQATAAVPQRSRFVDAPPRSEDQLPVEHVPLDGLAVRAPTSGSVVEVSVRAGDVVERGRQLAVVEAMKMEHVVLAPEAGTIDCVFVSAGDAVSNLGALLTLLPSGDHDAVGDSESVVDADRIRPDLAEAIHRHAIGLDDARPSAVERRRATGQRTARENVEDLCDAGSFVEYGPLAIAAQRLRRPVEELIERTPADGLVTGIGRINGDLFPGNDVQCAVLAYDYTVLAGTQGQQNHRKKDRMFEIAESARLPVVFFTEGGGGRPGDTDGLGVTGLDCWAFHKWARLSGLVPLVGISSGRCFAGNAALLGCCDVVIATEGSTIGMGGPAMIEGGNLGVFLPDEVGPMDVQVPNGVVDIAVADEAAAVAVAKQYLSYFQGATQSWEAADQAALRHAIPENRLRVYDMRSVIETMCDIGSVLELRREFGRGMISVLARFEGRPVGVLANDPQHLGGAIDADAADKAARFMQLCDAFDIPLLFLCDTPGFMVGPESERTALVRHCSRMFVVGANLTVPFFTIVLRKGYGLGAQSMAGGSFKAPLFTIAWPTGEFGAMGLEGAVRLGYRKELETVVDPEERTALFGRMVAELYEQGKAVSTASHFEIDDVVDPQDSRRWIATGLCSSSPPPERSRKKRPHVDTW